MKQSQVASSKAETYTWGVEIECFLPQTAINDLHISIGPYHHSHPLPSPFPQGWTAERDGSLRTQRSAAAGTRAGGGKFLAAKAAAWA